MKRFIVLLSILAFITALQDTQAQSIRSMMRKKIINDNLEAQAERDREKAVAAGEEPDKHPNTTMTHVYMDALGLSGNVDYESDYDFDAYIRMEVSDYNEKGKLKDKMIYDSYINSEAVGYAMVFSDKDSRSTIIFDDKNSSMLILSDNDGEKTGFAMGIDKEALSEDAEEYAEEPDTKPYDAYKTGKTKTILGYSCDEYLIEDESIETRMWVSEKLGKQVRREMLNNQQTFGAAFYYAAYMDGMALEYSTLDKEDGDRVVMLVTKIDLNQSHTISTTSYAVMSMAQPSED